ncbi:MAG: hypothetical protein ACXIUB_03300 [Wenzhouxiangella sp.]
MTDGNIAGLDDALRFCEERLNFHQKRSQSHLMLSLMALSLGGAVIFAGYINQFGEESSISTITISAFCVVAFGVLMALHRYHLTEIAKYEHFKLAFARLNIARSYSDEASEHIISSLTADAFNVGGAQRGSVQSPLPGHPTSDLSALLLSKLLDNAKKGSTANKQKQADA